MGNRQKQLEKLLSPFSKSHIKVVKLRRKDFNEEWLREITEIYKALGGILETPPINYGKYDYVINGMVIELDEENHFNRYRSKTLKSTIYKQNNTFNVSEYRKYCETFESNCRAYGNFWSNPSTEKQFGHPGEPANHSGNGSPRWKQRAFYDFLKDHLPLVANIPIVRLSIYNEFNGVTLNKILSKSSFEMKYSQVIWNEIVNRVQ